MILPSHEDRCNCIDQQNLRKSDGDQKIGIIVCNSLYQKTI